MNGDQHKPQQRRWLPRRVLSGEGEPVFAVLPQRVLANLRQPASENALVWNLVYPLARSPLSLASLLSLTPLWGTAQLQEDEDLLTAYFWGFNLQGQRLPGLDDVLQEIDGPGPQTEVDLFLVGGRSLVLVEAKNRSNLGRCARYSAGACPEVHAGEGARAEVCRYWQEGQTRFDRLLDFDPRPSAGDPIPACCRHYQMARSALVGWELGARNELQPHLWLITPRCRWSALEVTWLDFAERVRDNGLWKRMRVLAWEDIRQLSSPTRKS